MNERGLEVDLVIKLILGLIVLVIVALLIRSQLTTGASRYTQMGDEAGSLGACSNLLESRSCYENACPQQAPTEVPGTWPDCDKKKQAAPNKRFVCCKAAAVQT